ncbi:MAG: hypothetical protein QNK19_13035 [Xanthomonadales bacterium]|nr:hypothetical protein [Xanthomonadales bacterium]
MIKIKRHNLQTEIGLFRMNATLAPHFARAQAGKQLKILIFGGAGFVGSGELPLAIGETFC